MPAPLVPQYNAMQAQAGLTPQGMNMPPLMFPMGMPPMQTPHPGQVAGLLQQQAMMAQYVTPRPSAVFGSTTMATPGMFGPSLPSPQYGGNLRAREAGIERGSLGMWQGGVGTGLRTAGSIAATAMLGPLGGLAYEGLGIGQGVQNMSNAMFAPLVAQRERALAFQNTSNSFVTGGANLSASGVGLSGMAASQVTQGLGRMADNSQFKRDTGGMFNRADMDRIARMSGELGMLDNAQSADQILRNVKNVSKAVANLMKITGDPDVQKAMQQMGQMRSLGFSPTESVTAATNARTFARMAGVPVEQAMESATRGAAQFQAAGMSGASGFSASLGAQGMARQIANTTDPRRLSMMGGVEGIEQGLMSGAVRAQTNNALNMGYMMRGADGQLTTDPAAYRRFLGGQRIPDVMRQGGANMRQLGGGRVVTEEMLLRGDEINDERSASLTPMQQSLAGLAMAANLSRTNRMGVASNLMLGGATAAEARAQMQLMTPDALRNIRNQERITQRDLAVERRNAIRERSGVGAGLGRAFHHGIGRHVGAAGDSITGGIDDYFAEEQDREEALATQGDGPARIVSGDRYGSNIQAAFARDRLRTDRRGSMHDIAGALRGANRRAAAENARVDAVASSGNPLARHFYGPQGWGFTREGRGGDTVRDTILQGADLGTRARDLMGNLPGGGLFTPSGAEVQRMGDQQVALSDDIRLSSAGSAHDQITRARQAVSTFGADPNARRTSVLATSAATEGVRKYMASMQTLGVYTGGATQEGMQGAMRAEMQRRGVSESDITRALADSNIRSTAIADVRRGADESTRQAFDEMDQQGGNTRASRAAQSSDALRADTAKHRSAMLEGLGLGQDILGGRGTEESREDITAISDVLTGGDSAEETAMRQKVFTAMNMMNSDDRATRDRGNDMLNELRQGPDAELFEKVYNAVSATMGGLEESAREDMASKYEGKTAAEALQLTATNAEHIRQIAGNSQAEALKSVLGDRAALAFSEAEDAAPGSGVAALRRDPSKVTNERIRNMLTDGESTDEQITAAITQGTSGAIAAGTTSTAGGVAAEEGEGSALTEDMITNITSAMTEFPGAVTNLNTASQELTRAATQLNEAMTHGRINGRLNG